MNRLSFRRLLRCLAAGLAALLLVNAGAEESIRAVWIGQDGYDYCQTARVTGPNDIQDLHVRLEGLAQEPIEGLLLRRRGGGEWAFGNAGGIWTWKAHVIRSAGAPTADVFMEPSHKDDKFEIDAELTFQGGKRARFPISCGRSNPNLFMPAAILSAKYVGQEGHDWTGRGAGVGPDDFEDVRLDLTGISKKLEVRSIRVTDERSVVCEYGLNPNRYSNAELLRDNKDTTRGQLFFSPDRNFAGETLSVQIIYSIDRSNSVAVVAGVANPNRPMPAVKPIQFATRHLDVQWLGQDGSSSNRGDVHLRLSGLPADRIIEAAALSDTVCGLWIYRRTRGSAFYPSAQSAVPALTLRVEHREHLTDADLFFAPCRNEAGAELVLRVMLSDGATSIHRFAGQPCNPFERGSLQAPMSIEAKPGDDLNALAEKVGSIRLRGGRYEMSRPLKLRHPITISGRRDAVIVFAQSSPDERWRGAVIINSGNVKLDGFSLRCAPNFRWALHGPGGAAVIRADQAGTGDALVNLVLTNLDLEAGPVTPPADLSKAVESPYLVRMGDTTSGRIVGNRFRGGTVDVNSGPWEIRGNEHRGTPPGTVAWDAFAGHWLHDFRLENNKVHADGPSGKIWRFISMNQLGQGIVIRSNDVSDVGMRDDDKLPNPNAPEILLTESYRLNFEGKPSSISADGYVVQVPLIMYGAVRPGSVVSILTGPHAGEYARVAHPLSPTAFLMADPLPAGDFVISIAHGFSDVVVADNRIDVRGGKSAVVVLAGNHWGLRLLHNHLLGGGDSALLQSTPTENPFIWGWSHTPFMGFVAEENRFEGSLRGVSIDIYSNRHNKTSAGRTYLLGTFQRNTVELAPVAAATNATPLRVGDHSDRTNGNIRVAIR